MASVMKGQDSTYQQSQKWLPYITLIQPAVIVMDKDLVNPKSSRI